MKIFDEDFMPSDSVKPRWNLVIVEFLLGQNEKWEKE